MYWEGRVSEETGKKGDLRLRAAGLRQRAEDAVGTTGPDKMDVAPGEVLGLLHELQVHQVELEMQNDELRRTQAALEAARDRYVSLYEHAPVGYFTLDLEGKVIRVNATAAQILGREYSQVNGQRFVRFVEHDERPRFHFFWRELLTATDPVTAEVRMVRQNGTPFWARLHASMIDEDGDGEPVRVCRLILADITERRRAEEMIQDLNQELERRVKLRTDELARVNAALRMEIVAREQAEAELRLHERELEQRVAERTRELSTLLAISRNVSSTLELEQLLGIILDQLRQVVDYTGCAIYLLENDTLTVLDYRGPVPRDDAMQYRLRLDESVGPADVVRTRQPLIISDLQNGTPLAQAFRERASPVQRSLIGKSRSWMGVPLVVQNQVVGVLRLDHVEPGYFTSHHAQMTLAVANHAASAVENARLYRQAKEIAAMEERQRLARELHDSVAQTFYAIALATNGVLAMLQSDKPGARETLDYILSLSNTGLTEMSALIFDLRPESLRREGLVAALSKQIEAVRSRNDMQVDEELGDEPEASLEVKEVTYRIAQEALRNIVRHASARHVTLKLKCDGAALQLEVQDDGVGFDQNRVSAQSMGLHSMRERALSVGGTWGVESAPKKGTRVWAEIPVRAGVAER